ncbi:MAG: T9SS type A sorting domain-containing protein [Crocinitomicaceae bacterium]|nr:T9SS type A sorting domain-containing protein [Crocinitomicaceae bacterium]
MMKKALLSLALFCGYNTTAQIEIYSEDFQSMMPVDYTIVDNDGLTPNAAVSEYTEAWIAIPDFFDAGNSNVVAASTSFFEPIGQADRWMITPGITLGAYGNIASWKGQSHDPSFPDGYYVLVSGTDTQLSSFTDTLAFIQSEIADSLHYNEANLSELGFDNQTVHLAFVNRTNDGFKLYIDDIKVVAEDPVGLDDNSIVNIKVFPNPSTSTINITGVTSIEKIQILDLTGKVLIEDNSSSLNIESLEPGKYFIVINADNQLIQSSIVKL